MASESVPSDNEQPASCAGAHMKGAFCTGCFYALDGLQVGADCPECGTPSAHNRCAPLAEAPRAHIRRLYRGATCVVTGSVVYVAAMLLFCAALVPATAFDALDFAVVACKLVFVIAAIVTQAGFVTLGARDPRLVPDEHDPAADILGFAQVAVTMACIDLVIWGIMGARAAGALDEAGGDEFDGPLLVAAGIVAFVRLALSLAEVPAVLGTAQCWAIMLPDAELYKRCFRYELRSWMWVIGGIVFFPFALVITAGIYLRVIGRLRRRLGETIDGED